MYAYFDVDEVTFLKYQKLNKLKAGEGYAKQLVQLGLANDAAYPRVGTSTLLITQSIKQQEQFEFALSSTMKISLYGLVCSRNCVLRVQAATKVY